MIKIQDRPDLARDPSSGAVVSTDQRALELYKSKRAKEKQQAERLDILEQKMVGIENLLQEILKKL